MNDAPAPSCKCSWWAVADQLPILADHTDDDQQVGALIRFIAQRRCYIGASQLLMIMPELISVQRSYQSSLMQQQPPLGKKRALYFRGSALIDVLRGGSDHGSYGASQCWQIIQLITGLRKSIRSDQILIINH
jgi:hypothetical protein